MRKSRVFHTLFAASAILVMALLLLRPGPDKGHPNAESAIVPSPKHAAPVMTPVEEADVDAGPENVESREQVPHSSYQSASEPLPNGSNLGTFDPVFVSEEQWVKVATHWAGQYRKNRGDWVSHLESELARSDEELNSRDLEALAVSAVLRDPRFTYEPPLTAGQLSPVCGNLVCKVELPSHVRVTRDFSAVRLVPGSQLNTHGQVMFSHGFGYQLVLNQRIENTTTHYFLANGYEM